MSDDQQHDQQKPKKLTVWLQEAPGLGMALVVVVLLTLIGMAIYLLRPGNFPVDQARSTLAVMFSLATIALAFSLMLGAFLTNKTDEVKERFTLANQVLTPLIGIMGTILGFYFGSSQSEPPADPLAIVDILASSAVKAGEKLPITTLVTGGRGPWEFELTFTNNALPAIKRKVTVPHLRETVTIPNELSGQLGVTIKVTDATNTTATLERKVGEWITIEPKPQPSKPTHAQPKDEVPPTQKT